MDFMSKQTNLHTWLTKASQSYLLRSLAVVTSRLMWGMELSRRPIIFNLFLTQRQSKQ